MPITLRFLFDVPTDGPYVDLRTAKFDHDAFDRSLGEIRAFFEGGEAAEILVYCWGDPVPKTEESGGLLQLMRDVDNEASVVHRLLLPRFSRLGRLSRRVEMLRDLMEKYFVATRAFTTCANRSDYRVRTFDLPDGYDFQYVLPVTLAEKDVRELSAEEIATYLVPFYYAELGQWRNKSLLEDTDRMRTWSTSWLGE